MIEQTVWELTPIIGTRVVGRAERGGGSTRAVCAPSLSTSCETVSVLKLVSA